MRAEMTIAKDASSAAEAAQSGRRFARQTRVVAVATFASRVLGIVREQVIAYYFGAGAVTDAFVAAFRIPNLLRDFLAEGAFSAAFVPTFSEVLAKEGRPAAMELLRRVLGVFVPALAILCVLGIIFTPQIAHLLSGGTEETPGKIALLVHLARWMFPFLLLISLAAVLMGALNALGRFGIPALAPAGFNVGMILCAVLLSRHVDPPVLALAWGVLAGGFLQWAVQAVVIHREGFDHRLRLAAGWRDSRVHQIGRLLVPALLGQAAVQINILAITRAAWELGDGPVAYLNFAFRILFVPLGVFAVAASTVGLARLSKFVADGDEARARQTYRQALQTVLYLVIPTAVAFVALGGPICAALYERGEFGADATAHTARALAFYALGLPAMAAIRACTPLFFAHKDTRTPTLCGVAAVVANLAGMAVLTPVLGYAGLALSVGLSAVLQVGILLVVASRRYGAMGYASIAGHALVFSVIAALSVGAGYYLWSNAWLSFMPFGVVGQALAMVAVAAVLYLGATWLAGYRNLGTLRKSSAP